MATVRTRLRRALERLRVRLDDGYGDRASWCAALSILADPDRAALPLPATAKLSIGGVFVATTWKVVAAALVAAAAWWAWSTTAGGEDVPIASVDRANAAEPAIAQTPFEAPVADVPSLGDRTALARDESSASVAPPPSPHEAQLRLVSGRIVDDRGRAVADLRLAVSSRAANGAELTGADPARVHATTAADGSYSLRMPGPFIEVESADPRWILTCEGQPIGEEGQVAVAMPAIALDGIVVDESDAPLPDANVTASFNCAALEQFPLVLYGVESRTWPMNSAADGSFRFASLPSGCELSVSLEGYETARVREPEPGSRIVLRSGRPREGRSVRGAVVDEQGTAVVGARVRLGPAESTSDERGHFELTVTALADAMPLTATKPGWIAAVNERFGRTLREEPIRPDWIVLRLGGPALSITGRVLDAEGKPCAGWWIDLVDATPTDSSALTVERESADDASAVVPLVTDVEGHFRISGLRARSYRVRAFDSTRCLTVLSEPTPAGGHVLLQLPADAVHAVLSGRVLSQSGRPVRSAVVRLMVSVGPLTTGEEAIAPCREVQTDGDGRFQLERVPRGHSFLYVDGPHVEAAAAVPVPNSPEVELRASVRCRFRVELRAGDPADRFRVLDAEGKELRVAVQSAGDREFDSVVMRGIDGFPVCTVGDEAAVLVLYRGELELRRAPLGLGPDELHLVTP